MTSHQTPLTPCPRRPKTFADDQTLPLFSDAQLGQSPAAKVPSKAVTKGPPQTPASVKAAPAATANSPYARHKQRLAERNRKRFSFEGPRSVWDRVDAFAKTEDVSFCYAILCLLKLALDIVERRLRRQKRAKE